MLGGVMFAGGLLLACAVISVLVWLFW